MTFSSSSDETKMAIVTTKTTVCSGSSEYIVEGVVDDKKRRRMESNRESARRSRQRQQQHLEGLIKQIESLKTENEEFQNKIGEVTTMFTAFEAQNRVLKGEKDRLVARLEVLENVIDIGKAVKGPSLGDVEGFYDVNGDTMIKSWQLPSYSLPIVASSDVFCFNFD